MRGRLRPGFALRLALRELRHGLRRVGVYMASITLGVAALVSIHSFRDDVARSVREEANVLMGADARLSDDAAYPADVAAVIDSLRDAGVGVARVTTASTMVLAPRSGQVRLLQVRALDEGYPFYGTLSTEPPDRWGAHLEPGQVLVDPAVLVQLGVAGRGLARDRSVPGADRRHGRGPAHGPRVSDGDRAARAHLAGHARRVRAAR